MSFRMPNRNTKPATNNDELAEFKGVYINVGPSTETKNEDGETVTEFVRIPLGIELSRIKPYSVYANTDPAWAKKAVLVNKIIAALQNKARTLSEGESVNVSLDVCLYRRQEEAEPASANLEVDEDALEAQLFG